MITLPADPKFMPEWMPTLFLYSCVLLSNFKKCTILGLFKGRDAYSIFSFQYHLASIWSRMHVTVKLPTFNHAGEKQKTQNKTKKNTKEPKSPLGL